MNTASRVVVDFIVAVGGNEVASLSHCCCRHGAVAGSVQGRLVGRDVVYTFNDIDLAIGWPVVDESGPESRPCRASFGHVSRVHDKDVSGILLLRLNSDAIPSWPGSVEGRP